MLLFLLDKYVGVEWLDYMSVVYFWLPHIQGFHICGFDSTNWIENNFFKKTSHFCLDHSPPNSELQDTSLPTAPSPLASEPLHTLFPQPEIPFRPSPYRADSVTGAVHTP